MPFVHNGSCFTLHYRSLATPLEAILHTEIPPRKPAGSRATIRVLKQRERRNGGLLWSIVGAQLQAWIQYTVQKDSN